MKVLIFNTTITPSRYGISLLLHFCESSLFGAICLLLWSTSAFPGVLSLTISLSTAFILLIAFSMLQETSVPTLSFISPPCLSFGCLLSVTTFCCCIVSLSVVRCSSLRAILPAIHKPNVSIRIHYSTLHYAIMYFSSPVRFKSGEVGVSGVCRRLKAPQTGHPLIVTSTCLLPQVLQ